MFSSNSIQIILLHLLPKRIDMGRFFALASAPVAIEQNLPTNIKLTRDTMAMVSSVFAAGKDSTQESYEALAAYRLRHYSFGGPEAI